MYEMRIRYSQNGREIVDSLFRSVKFYWTKEDESAGRKACADLVNGNGCGMAQLYVSRDGANTVLHTTFFAREMAEYNGQMLHVRR
jgi:hypothetical protein